MMHTTSQLEDSHLEARDGTVGKVKDSYFDDQHWTIRHLVVDTGSWLSRKHGLLSPFAVTGIDPGFPRVRVALTREQVENSPDIDADRPVSRQHETSLFDYYGYPYYWYGPLPWGPVATPSELSPGWVQPLPGKVREQTAREQPDADPHLRSAAKVRGYNVIATDGSIGHVQDFLFDERDWAIRYVIVDTHNWLPGKHVLVEPGLIDRIDWAAREAHVMVTRGAVETSPEFDPAMTVSSDYRERLHNHYLRFLHTFHE